MGEQHNIEALYTPNQYHKLLKKYNQLFNIFRHRFFYELKSKFWIANGDMITDVRRWIVTSESRIFWDYLWATHSTGECLNIASYIEQKCRCVKFKFWSWKTLILSTNTSPNNTPEWIICLDEFYFKFSEYERKIFDEILMDINKFEFEHFHWIDYQMALFRAKTSSDLLTVLNATKE